MKKYLLLVVAATLATFARAAIDDMFTYQGLNFRVTSEDKHTAEVDKTLMHQAMFQSLPRQSMARRPTLLILSGLVLSPIAET